MFSTFIFLCIYARVFRRLLKSPSDKSTIRLLKCQSWSEMSALQCQSSLSDTTSFHFHIVCISVMSKAVQKYTALIWIHGKFSFLYYHSSIVETKVLFVRLYVDSKVLIWNEDTYRYTYVPMSFLEGRYRYNLSSSKEG